MDSPSSECNGCPQRWYPLSSESGFHCRSNPAGAPLEAVGRKRQSRTKVCSMQKCVVSCARLLRSINLLRETCLEAGCLDRRSRRSTCGTGGQLFWFMQLLRSNLHGFLFCGVCGCVISFRIYERRACGGGRCVKRTQPKRVVSHTYVEFLERYWDVLGTRVLSKPQW